MGQKPAIGAVSGRRRRAGDSGVGPTKPNVPVRLWRLISATKPSRLSLGKLSELGADLGRIGRFNERVGWSAIERKAVAFKKSFLFPFRSKAEAPRSDGRGNILAVGPSAHAALDQCEDRVEKDAEKRQSKQAGEGERHVEISARHHHDRADAAIRGYGF